MMISPGTITRPERPVWALDMNELRNAGPNWSTRLPAGTVCLIVSGPGHRGYFCVLALGRLGLLTVEAFW